MDVMRVASKACGKIIVLVRSNLYSYSELFLKTYCRYCISLKGVIFVDYAIDLHHQ